MEILASHLPSSSGDSSFFPPVFLVVPTSEPLSLLSRACDCSSHSARLCAPLTRYALLSALPQCPGQPPLGGPLRRKMGLRCEAHDSLAFFSLDVLGVGEGCWVS